MGSSGLISKKREESPRVESAPLTTFFEKWCPYYMSWGMTYNDYWHGEPYQAKFYKEAQDLLIKRKNEEFWMQGMYIYEALCDTAPVLHAFSKKGTKPLPYSKAPYPLEGTSNMSKQEKEQLAENERLKARLHFERWARDTAKQFKK